MKENFINETNDDTVEIDLSQLFHQIKKNIRLIIISMLLVAVIAFVFTTFFIDKKYASQARIYITPKVTEEGTVDYSSLTSGNLMVNNYMSILKGENLLRNVSEAIGTDFSIVNSSLSVSNDANTQIITIKSTTDDPELSKAIVDQTVSSFQSDMQELLNIQNLVVIDSAKVNSAPVSPNVKMNTLIGALIGAMLSGGYVFIMFILDKRLRNKKEAEEYLGIPVLAEIPWYED